MFFCSALYFVYLCWCFKVHSCILFCCYLNVHHCILFKGFHLDCVFQDYTLEGEFGFATDNFSRTGRIVERSTYGVYNFAPRLRLCIELVLGLYNSVGESSWCVQITSHRTSWRKSWPCCSRPVRRPCSCKPHPAFITHSTDLYNLTWKNKKWYKGHINDCKVSVKQDLNTRI